MKGSGGDQEPNPIADETLRGVRGKRERAASGSLVLVATPIGNIGDIGSRAIEALRVADLICCEDTRHTGQLLKRLDVSARQLLSLHAHNEAERVEEIIRRVDRGEVVALVSDAGTPLIADPGGHLVARTISAGLRVTTIPGPSAVVAALSISGLPADRFCFEGFLPRQGRARQDRLLAIADSKSTTVIYESPLRVRDTLQDLLVACGPDRLVSVVRELTKLYEEVWRGTLRDATQRLEASDRGEHVVIIAPAPDQTTSSHKDIDSALERLFAAGLSRRDAVSAVEILHEVSHHVAYERALRIETKGK